MQRFSKTAIYVILASILLLVVQIVPYLVLHEQGHILIHDNLDLTLVHYKILVETNTIFASNDTIVEPFMGGLPRSSFPTEFSFTMLWFWLFNPLDAYILERAIQAFIGFIGMYLLLRQHVIPGQQNIIIHIGVAFAFGLLPFWPFGGLSVAGLPLLLYAFLNLKQRYFHWYNWGIIALFPFYASLFFSGLFFMILLGIIVLWDTFKRRQINWGLVAGIILLNIAFIFTHYRLFVSFVIDTEYISHRSEWIVAGVYSAQQAIRDSIDMFLRGQYHAHSLHRTLILPTVLLAVFFAQWRNHLFKIYLLILLGLVLTSAVYGFWRWDGIEILVEPVISLFPLNLGRFHYLHPMLWFALFAISLVFIKQRFRVGQYIVLLAIMGQILYVYTSHELWVNRHTPSFKAFFAEEQFNEIRDYIDRPVEEYRVASIGIHPTIAAYSGFYTLDGYIQDYPLSYKHQFREVIAPELAKDEGLRRYYDNWGSRAYIFTHDLGRQFLFYSGNEALIRNLDLNLDAFRDLGGRYLLSAVEIDVALNPALELLNVFDHPNSAWDIFLYGIDENE